MTILFEAGRNIGMMFLSFNPKPDSQNAGTAGKARGLIQLTDQTIKTLSKPNNEIKDHYIKISTDDTTNPNISIAAGIRWLFHKKRLASGKLGREATWDFLFHRPLWQPNIC